MALTFDQIATVTVGAGGVATINFTSIPSTYTDLLLKYSIRVSTGSTDAQVIFNSNTSSIYTHKLLRSNAAVGIASGGATQGNDPIYVNWSATTASTFGNGELYICNYAGSNLKTTLHDIATANKSNDAWKKIQATLFNTTAAITDITIQQTGGTIVQNSTATLYGIKNTV